MSRQLPRNSSTPKGGARPSGGPIGFNNPNVQRLRRLLGRRSARHDEGAFVIEGPGLVAEAVAAGWPIEAQFVAPGGTPVAGAGPAYDLAPGVLERIAGTESPQPLLAIASIVGHELTTIAGATFVVVCAGLSDPGNLGTIIRTCEAAGADAVVLLAGSVDCWNPKVVRSSAGAVFHVPVVGPISGDDLDALGLPLIGTSSHAVQSYTDFDFSAPFALVLGNEAHGLDGAVRCAETVSIPHRGRSESLNVAMAAAVISFEAARQRSI